MKLESTNLPEQLRQERRICEGIRLPAGHRFYWDAERETWARFLDWMVNLKDTDSWFGTYTFRDYVLPARANKMMYRHLARLRTSVNHKSGGRLKYAVATEWQKREVIHFHTILNAQGLGSLSRKSWEARWENSGGGFAQLYDADKGAAPYLAKYLNKQRGGEITFGGAWLGTKPPKALTPVVVSEVLGMM